MWDTLATSLAVSFVAWPHTLPFPFYFYIWTLLFLVPNSPASETLYFFLSSFLLSHLYFTSYFTLHHLTYQYFKLIFGDWFSLLFSNTVPAVMDQMPKLSTTEILLSLSSF